MTQAVCFKCGAMKFGAFVSCTACNEEPKTDDELISSLSMTDHYFDMPTLQAIAAKVREGDPPSLDDASKKILLKDLNEFRKTPAGRMMLGVKQRRKKKGWWFF